MPLIDATTDTLFEQATGTAADYMREAVHAIDALFGDGYAAVHPDLVGAFMRTAAADFATSMATAVSEQSADKIAGAINGLLYGLKYSRAEGMSIGEAIVVSGDKVAEALNEAAQRIVDAGE